MTADPKPQKEQLYLEIEGQLYWYSTARDANKLPVYTYLAEATGDLKITASSPLETGWQRRIVVLDEFSYERTRIIKETLGTRYEQGSWQGIGHLAESIPENGINVRDILANVSKPIEIDRTGGSGTVWEQFASDPDEYEE